MTNRLRGETPVPVAPRPQWKSQPFVVYGTREIAAIQAALGPRPLDPYLPSVSIEEDEPVIETVEITDKETGASRQEKRYKSDAAGLVYQRRRVLLDHGERMERWLSFVTARFRTPDDEAVAICIKHGLARWAKAEGLTVDDELLDSIREELGRVRMLELNADAITNGTFVKGTGEPLQEDDPKTPSGVASSTSNI
jgi:hypothetical protein